MKCECGEEASNFHSKCCNAHFEGVIKNGELQVVCEKCGKYVGTLQKEEDKTKKEKFRKELSKVLSDSIQFKKIDTSNVDDISKYIEETAKYWREESEREETC